MQINDFASSLFIIIYYTEIVPSFDGTILC